MKLTGSCFGYFGIVLPALVLISLLAGCAVTDEAETLITVSPESAVVTLGDTEQFSVTPAGTVVTWSVNGILGGNEGTVGTVDTSGIYTAPTDAEAAPEKVIVRADTAGATASAVAFLTTFDANKRLTTHYTAGISRSNTYSSGQKNIAVFRESGTGDVNVYVVWSDNSSGLYKVYFTKSGDGGINFDAPVLVDSTSSGEQFSPSIAVDENGDVFIVWEDHGQVDADIFFRRYDSDTGSFGTKKQINADTTVSVDQDTTPSIAVSSGELYITWEHRNDEGDDYPDIYFVWSSNLGDTFQTSDYLSLSGRRPAIAMDSSTVAYVVWEDLGEGFIQFPDLPTVIKLRKIEDGSEGASISLEAVSGYNTRFPALAVDPVCNTGDTICDVYVIWQRALINERKFVSEVISSYDIDLTIVNGGTLDIIKTTLSVTDSGSSGIYGGSAFPAITADDSNIYMAWDDWRNGTKDIYFAKSSDGEDFSINRIVNDDTGSVCNFLCNEKPSIAVANGKAYVVWTDYRNTQSSTTASPNDVFFAVEQ